MFIKMLVRTSNYHEPLVGMKLVLGIIAQCSALSLEIPKKTTIE